MRASTPTRSTAAETDSRSRTRALVAKSCRALSQPEVGRYSELPVTDPHYAPDVRFAFAGWPGRAAWTAVMAFVAIVFVTGVDWPRWFDTFGTGVLVVGGLLLLRAPGPRWGGKLDPWAAAAAVYLATRPSYVAYGWWIPSEYVRWWL